MEENNFNYESANCEKEVDTIDSESSTLENGGNLASDSDILHQTLDADYLLWKQDHKETTYSHRLESEENLIHQNKSYITALDEFMEKSQPHYVTMNRKNEIKKDLYDCIKTITDELKLRIVDCKEIPYLISIIYESLFAAEDAESIHYSECIAYFVEFTNRIIEKYGYLDKPDIVEKVDSSGPRNSNDIAMGCLKVLRLLKEKGPYNPHDKKIKESRKALVELNDTIDSTRHANKGIRKKSEILDKEFEIINEKSRMVEQEITKLEEKTSEDERAAAEKLVVKIRENLAKQQKYVNMNKRIEFIEEELKEMPECTEELRVVKERINENSAKLSTLLNKNERTKATISTLNFEIDDLKKKIEVTEKDHEKDIQEMDDEINSLEIELKNKKNKLQESLIGKEDARDEYDINQNRLKTIEDKYTAAKEEARQRRNEKKKNMRAKRKDKEQLEKEIMRLSFAMGANNI